MDVQGMDSVHASTHMYEGVRTRQFLYMGVTADGQKRSHIISGGATRLCG
jgi:hypothetical protein